MKVNKLNNESGRSMVEMLGVLAIIGVLSVIGVYGYRQAMTRLKANEILQFAGIFYTQAMTSNGGNCLAGATNTTVGLDVPAIVTGAGVNSISITCPTDSNGKGTVTVNWGTADTNVQNALSAMNTDSLPYILAVS